MERPIRIFILDASGDFALLLQRELELRADLQVVGAARNGAEGYERLRAEPPDVLVTDLLLPGLDGLSLLRCLKREGLMPRTVVVSGFFSDRSAEALSRLGVAAYLAKPCSIRHLAARIREAAELPAERTENGWEPLIRASLREFGIPAHLDGHRYLLTAVKLAMEDREVLRGITKILYPALARFFGTSANCVERSIRSAVVRGWELGTAEQRRDHFGPIFDGLASAPTNARFIAAVADHLQSGYDRNGE